MAISKFTIQKSFAINAGAGSGKTYTLSRRYINAILGFDFFREVGFENLYYENLKPASTKQIVTITYTEAAALEMKERIFGLISKIIDYKTLEDEDGDKVSILNSFKSLNNEQVDYVLKTLQKALKESSDSKISTIHSYCLDILKTNVDIAKFDSSIDIIKDDEKDKILNEAKFSILNDPENTGVIKELSKYLNLYFLDSIFKMYSTSSTFREQFNSFNENSIDRKTLKELIFDCFDLPDLSDDLKILGEYFDEAKLDPKYKDFINKYVDNFFDFNFVPWSVLMAEYDINIRFSQKPFNKMKEIKLYIDNLKELDEYGDMFTAYEDDKENLFYKEIELLKSLMIQVKNIYNEKLKELGKLDFDEIISKTHQIIKDVNLDIKYMMVDEFQDTNSIQYEIIKNSLKKDYSNLFVVGDSKQSIYSFQGAEIEVFNDAINDPNYISSIEPMDINYRSDEIVLNSVNTMFKKLLTPNENIKLIKQNYEATPQNLFIPVEENPEKSKKDKGTFSFLINAKDKYTEGMDTNEYEQIAKFIASIKYGKLPEYNHIKELIDNKEKAIAVVFDSSTKMLELKSYLLQNNIECKVSASENFFHTKEINDIFNLLMTLQFPNDKFYKAAALRSNILRYSDDEIYEIIKNDKECEELNRLKELFNEMLLSEFILYVYQKYSFKQLQEYFSDSEQRKANLDKFLFKAIEHENINENDTYNFLKQCEKNIYFSEAKEDEAFFKSDNLESIQLCTIHSTKGLAYPMVIVANSDKNVYSQIQSDSIKSNSFTILNNNEKKLVTGFKVDNYEPLCFRLLKQIDKLKHLAEKKRLLYVALTRAEHDVIISGTINKKKDGDYSLSETSYLGMIVEGLDLEVEELFEKSLPNSIDKLEDIAIQKEEKIIENKKVLLKTLIFEEPSRPTSATKSDEDEISSQSNAAKLGTITHKIFELYWDKFEEIDMKDIYNKFDIEEDEDKKKIIISIEKFKSNQVYQLLNSGVEHRFELEFNYENKTGFIDLVYFDESKNGWVIVDFKTGNQTIEKEEKYHKQLEFYEEVLSGIGMCVCDIQILWV